MEIAIHYGLQGPTQVLSEQSQLQLRQALVLRLRILVPLFFLPTAVSSIAIMILDGMTSGFWFRCVGMLGIIVWVAVRVIGTVPINSATLTWKGGAIPHDWKALVARAERFHLLGVWAVVMAFASLLTSLALKIV